MEKQLLPENLGSESNLNVWKAVIVGWLIVNFPALIIMLSMLMIGLKIMPKIWYLFLIMGVVVGWTWWSFTIPRWRRWAHLKGAPSDKLQNAAVAAGLVWPKGSILEKTEIRIKE